MTEVSDQRIIKIEETDAKLQKKLDKDKIFKFECEKMNDQLRLGLKEINSYSPYYYERFYSKSELENENSAFKSLFDLDEIKEQLLEMFGDKETILSHGNNGNIIISFKISYFKKTKETTFELDKKTIENKDDGLMYLFAIQKKNIEIISKIRKQCLKNKNDETSQKILQLLVN